jgi:Mor family transcriptional regulator
MKNDRYNLWTRKTERNNQIIQMFESGMKKVEIARQFNISKQRVGEIIKAKGENKNEKVL